MFDKFINGLNISYPNIEQQFDCGVEKYLFDLIISSNDIYADIKYISLYNRSMNLTSSTLYQKGLVFMDTTLNFFLLSFLCTTFSLSHDKSIENINRCIKSCFTSLDLVGINREIGTYNTKETTKMIALPSNVLNLIGDAYWAIWTFLIGHELYHIVHNESDNSKQDEFYADAYGYKILIDLIIQQSTAKTKDTICPFHQYMYLSPIMLLECLNFLDFYKELCGNMPTYTNHPTPSERINALFELYETHIPDEFDTYEGNIALNHFLESVDFLKNQIAIKKKLGKLNI